MPLSVKYIYFNRRSHINISVLSTSRLGHTFLDKLAEVCPGRWMRYHIIFGFEVARTVLDATGWTVGQLGHCPEGLESDDLVFLGHFDTLDNPAVLSLEKK